MKRLGPMCLTKIPVRDCRTHRSALRKRGEGRTLLVALKTFLLFHPITCMFLWMCSLARRVISRPRSLFRPRGEPQNGFTAVYAPIFSHPHVSIRGPLPSSSCMGCAENPRLMLYACAAAECEQIGEAVIQLVERNVTPFYDRPDATKRSDSYIHIASLYIQGNISSLRYNPVQPLGC